MQKGTIKYWMELITENKSLKTIYEMLKDDITNKFNHNKTNKIGHTE